MRVRLQSRKNGDVILIRSLDGSKVLGNYYPTPDHICFLLKEAFASRPDQPISHSNQGSRPQSAGHASLFDWGEIEVGPELAEALAILDTDVLIHVQYS